MIFSSGQLFCKNNSYFFRAEVMEAERGWSREQGDEVGQLSCTTSGEPIMASENERKIIPTTMAVVRVQDPVAFFVRGVASR